MHYPCVPLRFVLHMQEQLAQLQAQHNAVCVHAAELVQENQALRQQVTQVRMCVCAHMRVCAHVCLCARVCLGTTNAVPSGLPAPSCQLHVVPPPCIQQPLVCQGQIENLSATLAAPV